ncbi:conserved hypothetical protein [Burkholderia mallei PRL-20]|nr:conserved hypothetical protein [Burkholderia mallei SAVP1]ABO04815.1 conserved hypothetical protein [Burkholderia mallei NCTC 10247]EDK60121.1 conserved hypothetical protein [Burkholderia mallei JHU]EEP86243.1 conserved hypothetical protein [Burkholderia mallei GB8 horse 4]EES45256.1 conserved hypothetical protein [Burkholderia mallei PRL-20]
MARAPPQPHTRCAPPARALSHGSRPLRHLFAPAPRIRIHASLCRIQAMFRFPEPCLM